MRLVAPDLNSRRARLADWLELEALTSARGQVSVSSIRSQIRRVTNERTSPKEVDADADDTGEPEITERLADDFEEKLFEELSFRAKTIGTAYPFELITEATGRSHILRLRSTWMKPESGELIYIFCLLDSGIRDGLISYPPSTRPLVHAIGNVFQICSCIAVGGYTNAEVISFGFPRATGDAFLPALQAAWHRYGSYEILESIPHGFDVSLKDGGVDIIAWQQFDDGCAATFLMFVQVASGLDWKDKAVAEDVRTIRQWFSGTRFEHFLPAICIPFPLWFDLDEPPVNETGTKLPFLDGVVTQFAYREAKFGVIFDRGRISRSCARILALSSGPPRPVDGLDRVNEVAVWVSNAMSKLAEVREDA